MIPTNCDTCDGTGRIDPEDVGTYNLGGDCGDCDGTGQRQDEP